MQAIPMRFKSPGEFAQLSLSASNGSVLKFGRRV